MSTAYHSPLMSVNAASLSIVHFPHPVLRQKAQRVMRVNEEVRSVALRMIQLMHEAPGVGLAAPQVGLSWRMFVANATGEPGDDLVFINPVLLEPGRDMQEREEGCLSLPRITGQIRRPRKITIEAQDLLGNFFRLTSDQLPARIWQHEMDHLNGVLIIDRMSEKDLAAMQPAIRELTADDATEA